MTNKIKRLKKILFFYFAMSTPLSIIVSYNSFQVKNKNKVKKTISPRITVNMILGVRLVNLYNIIS